MTVRALSLVLAALATAPAAQLSYVEITGTAGNLGWDGGRTELELGDVNGDGHVDVVTVGDHGSPFVNTQMHGITAWLGNGAGGWVLRQTGTFGYGGLALGDANGDGLVDVGYGVHHDYSGSDLGDQLLEVALGDGTGAGWTPWDDGLATAGETWGMFACDFGDVDADGDLDLASISFGCCAGVQVYLNEGDGTWTHSYGFLGGNSDEILRFADFDGDGRLDLAAGSDVVSVLRGDGAGGFTSMEGNLPTAWLGLGAGDVDGDGRDELSFRNASGGLEVWSWTPGDVWVPRTGNLPATGDFQATELADMDRDGLADLAAFGDGAYVVASWRPGDAWTVLAQGTVPGTGGKSHEAFRAGVDLDHNGHPDFAVVQEESDGSPFGISQNHLHLMAEASTAAALDVRVASPGAGRRWAAGQARFVDWTAAVPPGETATIDLELSTSGPTGPWLPLAAGLPNGGRHQLVAPDGVHSTACHVRVTATTASATSQHVGPAFTIADPGRVEPYGCGVNPAGSLTILGEPAPGTTLTFALDDPEGVSPSPSTGVVLVALQADGAFPCGLLLPGLGMGGPLGELLVSVVPPNPVLLLPGSPAWTSPGDAVTAELLIPLVPDYTGLDLYVQGALVGVGSSKVTEGWRVTVGAD